MKPHRVTISEFKSTAKFSGVTTNYYQYKKPKTATIRAYRDLKGCYLEVTFVVETASKNTIEVSS